VRLCLEVATGPIDHHEWLLATPDAEKDAASREVAQREALVSSVAGTGHESSRQEHATQAREDAEAAKKESSRLLTDSEDGYQHQVQVRPGAPHEAQTALAARLESQK